MTEQNDELILLHWITLDFIQIHAKIVTKSVKQSHKIHSFFK